MQKRLRVLFLEPFDGGSHRAFARGWAAHSRHRVRIAALPARFWKWRLRGAAFSFAEKLGGSLDRYDAVVATSMMNAADFAAATRLRLPLVVYFHENQLSYPRPADEPLDHGLALASLASAAAADAVVFNSAFHRDAFLRGLEEWSSRFPEFAPAKTARAIRRRSRVIPPGIEWDALAPLAERKERGKPMGLYARDGSHERRGRDGRSWRDARKDRSGRREQSRRIGAGEREPAEATGPAPLIVWNHRWEFDKNPPAFFWALDEIAKRGRPFRLALLGENSQFVPKPFLEARERYGERIVRYGYVPSIASYRRWLGKAGLVVSTARQENFGLSVVEAIAAGVYPLLPERLSYPEILPARFHADCLYRSQSDLVRRLDRLLANPVFLEHDRSRRSRAMGEYGWSKIAPRLDALLENLTAQLPDFRWTIAGRTSR